MHFELIPHTSNGVLDHIAGELNITSTDIHCCWQLDATDESIDWPPITRGHGVSAGGEQCRHMNLWEHSCFELFFRIPEEETYYEFNVSPSGHWNSFEFTGLRNGMSETSTIRLESCVSSKDGRKHTLSANLVHELPTRRLQVGVCAIVEFKRVESTGTTGQQEDASLAYYALSHPGVRPDFHHPRGHVMAFRL
jgi:hypothetical protein